jgi:transposase-like protein
MAHRRAKLTVFGRQLLVGRVELEGWTVARAAEMSGVSRQTATKWVRRHRAEGAAGLEDRTSRPRRSPRAMPQPTVDAILRARHELGVGPHRLAPVLDLPRSTIGDVLERHGLSRLADRDRPTGIPIRSVRERPGELLHMDVKKLGRIPDGGGHRFRGRGHDTPRSHRGCDFVHQVVDDMSRVAYVAVFPDERGTTCAAFLREAAASFARLGVRIERVMTDNAKNCTASRCYTRAIRLDAYRHRGQPSRGAPGAARCAVAATLDHAHLLPRRSDKSPGKAPQHPLQLFGTQAPRLARKNATIRRSYSAGAAKAAWRWSARGTSQGS